MSRGFSETLTGFGVTLGIFRDIDLAQRVRACCSFLMGVLLELIGDIHYSAPFSTCE